MIERRTAMRQGLIVATLITALGCDSVVRARLKVVSPQGEAIPEALVRLDRSGDHDLARFTDDKGCAYFTGVVSPGRKVVATVGKPGYRSRDLKLRTLEESCLIVRLVPDGENGNSSSERMRLSDCPCPANAGYSPMMSARFKISTADGSPLERVGLRRSDRPRNPWLQVSEESGCLGVRWIVAAGVARIPLVLEKAEYQPAHVEVPTLEDRCYGVTLSRSGVAQASTVVALASEECTCPVFAGKTTWPEK